MEEMQLEDKIKSRSLAQRLLDPRAWKKDMIKMD